MKKIVVLGVGSWGTALARVFALNHNEVMLWGRDSEQIAQMKRTKINHKYLDKVLLPDNLSYTDDIEEAVRNKEIIVLAVSSQANRGILERIQNHILEDAVLVNVSKGLEKNTNLRASQISREILPKNPFVVLSGPSHAEEVAVSIPTTLVSSSENYKAMEMVQKSLSNEFMRVYTNVCAIK